MLMPRNPTKHVYVTIGLPRDSATYAALLADSNETGLSIAQLIATRIADWYRQGVAGTMTSTRPGPLEGHQQATASVEEAPASARELEQRAAQAAAAWASFDEE
jgi:hypothetical protein